MSEHITNLTDDTFDATIKSTSGAVLVDFWASWCGPCLKVGPVLEEIAQEHADNIKIMKVDVDANPNTAMQYGIQSIPTMIIFKDGVPTETRIIGAKGKEAILEDLRSASVSV